MNFKILNGNVLKIVAALAMLIDHIGVMFFPDIAVFRIIGRLAFPIFAFMISEGARYTSHKLHHFLSIASLSVICQVVYILAGGFEPFNILITFSFSILIIYSLNNFKEKLFSLDASLSEKTVSFSVFFAIILLVYLFSEKIHIDYGFFGCLAPAFASIFDFRGINAPEKYAKLDCIPLRVICMYIPITALIIHHITVNGDYLISPFLFMALPILLLYSEKRGTKKLKYFFYIFYPLHLAALEGIYILTKIL